MVQEYLLFHLYLYFGASDLQVFSHDRGWHNRFWSMWWCSKRTFCTGFYQGKETYGAGYLLRASSLTRNRREQLLFAARHAQRTNWDNMQLLWGQRATLESRRKPDTKLLAGSCATSIPVWGLGHSLAHVSTHRDNITQYLLHSNREKR